MQEHSIPLLDARSQFDTAGVYKIEYQSRIYIGQSVSIASRVREHIAHLESGKHSNSQLQRDWNRGVHEDFMFSILLVLDYKDIQGLRRAELKEIQLHRNHGFSLYNDFRMVPEDRDVIMARISVWDSENKESSISNKQQEAKQPSEYGTEISTCHDCGQIGAVHKKLFRCPDKVIRCDLCIEYYLDGVDMMLSMSHEKVGSSSVNNSVRRWQMAGRPLTEEIKFAGAAYVILFDCLPNRFLINEADSKQDMPDNIYLGDYTPRGYIDMPI